MAVRYFDENFEEQQAVFVSDRVEAAAPGTKIINAPTGAMLVTVEVCRMCGDAKRLPAKRAAAAIGE